MHRIAGGDAGQFPDPKALGRGGTGAERGPTLRWRPRSAQRGGCNPFRVGARAIHAYPSGVARRYVLRPFQGRNAITDVVAFIGFLLRLLLAPDSCAQAVTFSHLPL